jgi:hypothetical protein
MTDILWTAEAVVLTDGPETGDDGSDILLRTATLEIVTDDAGFFGNDDEDDNPRNDGFDARVIDPVLGTVELDDPYTVRATFQTPDGPATSVFAGFEVEDRAGNDLDRDYLFLVEGTPLPAFTPGTQASAIVLAEPEFAPPGYGFDDFVAFADMASFARTGEGAPEPGDTEYTWLVDAIAIRDPSPDDDDDDDDGGGTDETFEGPVRLRVITDETGFFGGGDEVDNPLNDDVDLRVIDPVLGEVRADDDDIETVRISFETPTGTASAVYAVLDLEDDDGGDLGIGYIFLIEGTPLPDVAPGTRIESVLLGEPDFAPPGYGLSDFIAFADIPAFERLGDDPATPGVSTEEARTIAYLYEANFDRVPDIDGLNFWIDTLEGENALTEREVAEFFLASDEFEERFGDEETLDDRTFVETLYRFVLDREGDQPGIDFWTGVAEDDYPRAQLLLDFVESQENADALEYVLGLDEVSPGEWEFV